jgi:hypothetical protein
MILRQGLIILFVSFLVVNCKKDKDNCAQLEEKYHIAGGEFWNHPGPQACANYKTAILSYMNSGCLTEEQKEVLARQLEITNNPALCP